MAHWTLKVTSQFNSHTQPRIPPTQFFVATDAGTLAFTKDEKNIFEVNLGNVSQCLAKGNELDVSFVDSESANREDQAL